MLDAEQEEEPNDCSAVVKRFLNTTIDTALHQRFHHKSPGTLEEICLRVWEGALLEEMRPLLRQVIEERGYVGETGTPPPGSPHERSYYVRKRRAN